MKLKHRRRRLFASLIVLVCIIAIPAWLLGQEVRHQKINRNLIASVKRGDASAVLAYLSQGADPNVHDRGEMTIVQIATEFLNRLRGKSLLSDHSESVLFLAISAERKNRAIIDVLLKHGADPNVRGDYFKWKDRVSTGMLYAAMEGDAQTIQALAKAGADANVQDEYGQTTLNIISYFADAQTVQTLLEKGANPNIRDQRGTTPLIRAVHGWNAKVVRLLIEHGADRNMGEDGSMGKTVLLKRLNKLLALTVPSKK